MITFNDILNRRWEWHPSDDKSSVGHQLIVCQFNHLVTILHLSSIDRIAE